MPEPVRRKAEIAYVESESEQRVTVLDLDRPAEPPLVLTGSCAVIWTAVDGERGVDEIVALVAEEYGVGADVVGRDVRAFLEDLVARGVLVSD